MGDGPHKAFHPCPPIPLIVVLRRSFILLSGIGEKTERTLWSSGIGSWHAYSEAEPDSLPARVRKHQPMHQDHLRLAEACLARGELAPFARWLPPNETWRVWEEAGKDVLYLDIETSGLSYPQGYTTVVGMHQPSKGTRLLVRGHGLTGERLQEALDDASALVTFNGRGFDMPFLEREFGVRAGHLPHIDLMNAFHKVGVKGGLKRIETFLGLAREGDIAGLSGYDAVRLWKRWETGRDHGALETLLAYNEADVVNMVPLAAEAYARCSSALPWPAAGGTSGDLLAESSPPLDAWVSRG